MVEVRDNNLRGTACVHVFVCSRCVCVRARAHTHVPACAIEIRYGQGRVRQKIAGKKKKRETADRQRVHDIAWERERG